jgi:RNA polymerase sigma-70 factor (ECF subfamily)
MPTRTPPDLEAILSDLRAAVTAQSAPVVSRAHPWRRLALAVPLAVAVAAALFVGLGVGNEQPAAARQLHQAARLVAGEPAPAIGPGQYWYVKGIGAFANSVGGASGTFTAMETSSHEIWITSDSSGRVLRKDGPPRFFSAAERARWEAAGKPGFGGAPLDVSDATPGSLSWGWEVLGVRSAAEIPTDPGALARLVGEHAGQTKNPLAYQEFQLITGILRFAPLSGAQTAAFYEVLAALPGIELVGATTDPLGRAGTAFAVERGGPIREEIILDPRTGRLLGSRLTLIAPDAAYADAPIGTTVGYETIVSTGVVGSTDARP